MSGRAKTNGFLSSLCVRVRERERGRKDKKWSEMCAALSFFPRTEVSGGLIFLTAVRPGRGAETVRGSCFLRQTPAPPDVAFDPARLPWQTTPLPPHTHSKMRDYYGMSMPEEQHMT